MHEHLVRTLKANEVEYRLNLGFCELCSIRIGGVATLVILPDTIEKLVFVLDYLRKNKQAYKIVGNMTNILPTDGEFTNPIISTRKIRTVKVDNGIVNAHSGATAYAILKCALALGFGGIEPLSGIPGTLGGLIAMNAGAFGKEISDFLLDACVFDTESGRVFELSRDDLSFSYRSCAVKQRGLVVLSARLSLIKKDYAEIFADTIEYRRRRLSSQPTEPSLGSVFKRIDGQIPAKIIDTLGLKGTRIGGAEISKKHAGFIVNLGGATASDYKALVKYIKAVVYDKLQISLKEEIEYL
jgi:UDP-N-acetylmuramate dehydrogenase